MVVDIQNQNFSLLETCESNIQSPLDLKSLRRLGDLLALDIPWIKDQIVVQVSLFSFPEIRNTTSYGCNVFD